jgi:hypothetical protein
VSAGAEIPSGYADPAIEPRLIVGDGPFGLEAECALGTYDPIDVNLLIDELEAAELRGRGGAGFPAHIKWRAVASAQGTKVVVGNGEEGEPAPKVELDHGLVVPLRVMLQDTNIPVVPIITQPARGFSPFGAKAFGLALRDAIERSGKRVGFLATGGLSHWLEPGKYGKVDEAFDGFILDLIKAGRGLDISNFEPYPLLDHGQYEILNWVIMLAVVGGGVKGEVYAYEPMQNSGGGWAVANMKFEPKEVEHA